MKIKCSDFIETSNRSKGKQTLEGLHHFWPKTIQPNDISPIQRLFSTNVGDEYIFIMCVLTKCLSTKGFFTKRWGTFLENLAGYSQPVFKISIDHTFTKYLPMSTYHLPLSTYSLQLNTYYQPLDIYCLLPSTYHFKTMVLGVKNPQTFIFYN